MSTTTLNLQIPTAWNSLSQEQLYYTYTLLSSNEFPLDEVKVYCFLRFSGLKQVRGHSASDHGSRSFVVLKDGSKYQTGRYILRYRQISEHLDKLNFLGEIPQYPIRLEFIKYKKRDYIPRDARFADVPFQDYLQIDNLYVGYLHTRNSELLDRITAILYQIPDYEPSEAVDKVYSFNTLMWIAGFKNYCLREFPDLFTGDVSSISSGDLQRELTDSMNAQILALTGGDLTKERQVLESDTIRALTNLNAIARQAKKLNEK